MMRCLPGPHLSPAPCCNTQKCTRAGRKHNDFNAIGNAPSRWELALQVLWEFQIRMRRVFMGGPRLGRRRLVWRRGCPCIARCQWHAWDPSSPKEQTQSALLHYCSLHMLCLGNRRSC